MKRALRICLTGLLSVGMMSCGMTGCHKSTAVSQSKNKTDLTTGELRVTAESWMYGKYDFDTIKRDFESKHPGVTVRYQKVDTADTTTNMLQWASGKTNCDITIGGSREEAVAYVAKNYIISFGDDFFAGDLKKSNFVPSFLELGNINGTQYCIPVCCEVDMISVNKKLMAKAGLLDAGGNVIPATTWDQLYDYAQKATVRQNGVVTQTGLSIDWGTNNGFQSYMASLQGIKGTLYGSDKKTLDFTSGDAAQLFTVWKKLVDNGYTPIDTFADEDAGRTNFKAGKVAMLIAPASRSIEAQPLLGKDNVTTMPIPGTDKNGSLAFIQAAMIPRFSAHVTLAKDFIQEGLLNRDFLVNCMDKYGKLSPLKAYYEGQDAVFQDMLAVSAKSATAPLYQDYKKLDPQFLTEFQKYIKGQENLSQLQSNLKKLEGSLNLTTGLK